MTIQEQYQIELARSEAEHHQPTAGAMIGHVTANLWLHALKIEQAMLFAKGAGALFLAKYGQEWLTTANDFRHQLNEKLRAEDDLVPTTSTELVKFSMLTEDATFKYATDHDQIFDLIKAFDTQLLFIKRAIVLAEKEAHYGQEIVLKALYAWMRDQILVGQKFLGHDLQTGLYVELDDDED